MDFKSEGEILKLEWSDIDFENQVVQFRGATTKSHKTQFMPMSSASCNILKLALKLKTCEYVFPSNKETCYHGGFDSIWKHIKKKQV